MKDKHVKFLTLAKKDPITLFEMIPELKDELALTMLEEKASTLIQYDGIRYILEDSDWFMTEAEGFHREMIEALKEDR